MKKLSFLTALILFAFVGFFTGCDDTTQEGPAIQFFGGVYIDDDATVAPGGILKFSWVATKGSSNLASFTIEREGITLAGYPDETIPNDNYQDSVSLEAPLNEAAYVYELIVTDKNDLTASGSFTITVSGGPIKTWTKTLGSWNSNTGSSFASITGDVYQIAEAKANSEKIDFLYYYGANNLATLAAPDDADAANVFTGTSGVATWSTLNSTKFKVTTLTAAEFDAIANDLLIVSNVNPTEVTASTVHPLEVGDVVAFITDADKAGGSKKGLAKVAAIATGAGGTMDIVVKVQE
jgi:hypothetical protein